MAPLGISTTCSGVQARGRASWWCGLWSECGWGRLITEVVRRVVEVARNGLLAGARRLVVDATGVGLPVVDMLRAARPGCEIAPVLITGGATQRYDGRMWHVPKVDLLAGLQGMLERGELKIARQDEGVGDAGAGVGGWERA